MFFRLYRKHKNWGYPIQAFQKIKCIDEGINLNSMKRGNFYTRKICETNADIGEVTLIASEI